MQQVKWAEFELQELFEKLNLKCKNANFSKDRDLSKVQNSEFNLPLVNAKHGDNGIMYYGRESDFDYAEMTIDIVGDGAVSTGNIYPQPQKTGVLYNAYLIKPKFKANQSLLFFYATIIQKSIKLKFGYENKAGWEKVKKEKIQLPINPNQHLEKIHQIDFEFMESFIAELEAQRLAELEAYLLATGLKDTQLTAPEKQALSDFQNGKIQWTEFALQELFDSANGDFDIQKNHINDTGEYVITAGLTNNGILGKTNITAKIFEANTITVDMFGNPFYRQFPYKMVTHARVFSLKPKFEITDNEGLFLSSSLHHLKYHFGYENMCSWAKIKKTKILLPTPASNMALNSVHSIDFDFMETLISAIQKIVIQDVVRYADAKIAATQHIIDRPH